MKTNQRGKRGFTLMEMLIVVAIIGILIAVAIPTFTSSLHKARVAADMANVRAYYAELQVDYLLTGKYADNIGDDMWTSITDTLVFPDGTTVKLQAGQCGIIRPEEQEQDQLFGYQIHYFCNGSDYCNLTLGANDNA